MAEPPAGVEFRFNKSRSGSRFIIIRAKATAPGSCVAITLEKATRRKEPCISQTTHFYPKIRRP